ncbi:MAG: hypothetical protein ACFFAQ_04890 [Promethearchaeota archaeon]
MNRVKIKKRIKATSIFLLLLGTIILNVNWIYWNFIENNSLLEEENPDEFESFNFQMDNLMTSDYQSEFTGSGEDINIKLHQSYLNDSFNTALNTSDSNNNKFTLPCPTDTSFNSSYTKFEIEDIIAPNKTLIIEDETSSSKLLNEAYFTSFEIIGKGYLENLSVYLSQVFGGDDFFIDVYNSYYTGTYTKFNQSISGGYKTVHLNESDQNWYDITNWHVLLDPDLTYDNTFFIRASCFSSNNGYWHHGTDGIEYNSIVWRQSGPVPESNIDMSLKIYLSPLNNTPRPEQINLEINNKDVNKYNDIENTGYWESADVNSSVSGDLEYTISADWWDVTCSVSKALINYTKTDLKATSSFDVPASGQSINWNSTLGTINDFDVRFNDYIINFTVPNTWENFTATDGSVDKTSVSLGPIFNQYRDLQIRDAGNGINWYITAQSYNLLQAIDMYKGIDKVTKANYSDTISFIARFIENIVPGTIGVNLSVYNPILIDNKLNFTKVNTTLTSISDIYFEDWIISDWVFQYGIFRVQVFWNNGSAAGFLEETITIYGETELNLISPESGQEYFIDQVFNITIYYNDIGQTLPIINAIINNNGTLTFFPNGTAGYYTTELNTSDFVYGWNYIEITASKTYYNEAKTQFSFHLRMYTTISPSNTKDFGDVLRGYNVSYTFYYSDVGTNPVSGATIENVSLPLGFIYSANPVGGTPGNYTIELDTSGVLASDTPYTCIFNITAVGKQTQYITLTLRVIFTQTDIQLISYDNYLIRKDKLNQSIEFYFNDTDNNQPITGLSVDFVTVKENQTGGTQSKWLYPTGTPGQYLLNVSTAGLDSGWIQFEINISFDPNYNTSIETIEFYLRGNLTQTHIDSISDIGGDGTLTPTGYNNYLCFIERDLYLNFTITDDDFSDELVAVSGDSYEVDYIELTNTSNEGSLTETLFYDLNTKSFKGYMSTSGLTSIGTYTINVTVSLNNYEKSILSFNITLKAKYIVNISVVYEPLKVKAGEEFTIVLKAMYNNGTDWLLLVGENMVVTPYFNGVPGTPTSPVPTNDTGEAEFEITVIGAAKNMNLSAQIQPAYNHIGDTLLISDIEVTPLSGGPTFEDFMPYIIIIGAVAAVGAGSVAIYRGLVVPKKREKKRVLTEVRTIFDDAINLEHILVLYKGTGTCVFFKSFGSEAIDPELISGFISAVSSFGKEMVAQKALNEITYGDKMLLLADGEYIRVALVLSKNASMILRKHLTEFIVAFEKTYESELPSWRGQLNVFRNAGLIIDEIFNTSIILPHKITYEFSDAKTLKTPHSKDVLKIAHSCCEEAERDFFFIATLLKEATERTKKDTAEIFSGIKELRDKKILMSIEISTIEARPISQQELNLISQKVAGLVRLSPEEKQKLVNDLAQMGPAEREAYFVSIAERHEIVSAPMKVGAVKIDNLKSAKKEIKNLKKNAALARKENDYDKVSTIYHNALMIATNWEIQREFEELEDLIRKTKIVDFKIKLKNLEKEAKLAAKKENYNEAAQKFRMASRIASEIFKLGVTEMTKEVKRLSNKSKEYEKLI